MERYFRIKFITPPENALQAIFRFLSAFVVVRLSKTSITPNQVTFARMGVVIVALLLFIGGSPLQLIWAVGLFYVFEILDHVDGDLARYTKQFSATGPLLEQFIDTWSSRPANIFGLCVALGMYRNTDSIVGLILFGMTALGRMLWLEYRDDFGWVRAAKVSGNKYTNVIDMGSVIKTIKNIFEILYIWNNTFLLMAALFYIPLVGVLPVDPLVLAFLTVAILNNIPWVVILYQGFRSAQLEQTASENNNI